MSCPPPDTWSLRFLLSPTVRCPPIPLFSPLFFFFSDSRARLFLAFFPFGGPDGEVKCVFVGARVVVAAAWHPRGRPIFMCASRGHESNGLSLPVFPAPLPPLLPHPTPETILLVCRLEYPSSTLRAAFETFPRNRLPSRCIGIEAAPRLCPALGKRRERLSQTSSPFFEPWRDRP